MKKSRLLSLLLGGIAILALSLMITSCNMNMGWGNFKFTKVHIFNYGCIELDSWKDTDGPGIEVETKDYGWIFISEGQYMLIEDTCPICEMM